MNKLDAKKLFIERFGDYVSKSTKADIIYNTRLDIINNVDYVMNDIQKITNTIIEKYNPEFTTVSDYLENIFNKQFYDIMRRNFSEPTPLNELCLYLTAYLARFKNEILKKIDVNSHLIDERKKDNLEHIVKAYELLNKYYPGSPYISKVFDLGL